MVENIYTVVNITENYDVDIDSFYEHNVCYNVVDYDNCTFNVKGKRKNSSYCQGIIYCMNIPWF